MLKCILIHVLVLASIVTSDSTKGPGSFLEKLGLLSNTLPETKQNYFFSLDIEGNATLLFQLRDEVHDGPNVRGSYLTSDGHYWRKIIYVGDKNGYTVKSDAVHPLKGPEKFPCVRKPSNICYRWRINITDDN